MFAFFEPIASLVKLRPPNEIILIYMQASTCSFKFRVFLFFFCCPDIFPPWDLSKLNALICETPRQENCHSFPGCQQKRNLKCKFNLRQDARLKASSRPVVPRFNCPNEKDEGPAGKTGKWVVGK